MILLAFIKRGCQIVEGPMPRQSRENPLVREFILRNVRSHPANIAAITAAHYNLSRPAVAGYLRRLASDGLVKITGTTRNRRYTARELVSLCFEVELSVGLSED